MKNSLSSLLLLTTFSTQSALRPFLSMIRTKVAHPHLIRSVCTNTCSKQELTHRFLEDKRDKAINKAESLYQKTVIYTNKKYQNHVDIIRYNARKKKEKDIQFAWKEYKKSLEELAKKTIKEKQQIYFNGC